jgi:hypothetical protein
MDGGGDRPMGTDGGGGGTRQRCKNRRQKHNGSSLVPNTTKVTIGFSVGVACCISSVRAFTARARALPLPTMCLDFGSELSGPTGACVSVARTGILSLGQLGCADRRNTMSSRYRR